MLRDSGLKRGEFARRVEPSNVKPEVVSALPVMFDILSRGKPEMWDELMPQVLHVHGKFSDFDANGSEPTIPTRTSCALLAGGLLRLHFHRIGRPHAQRRRQLRLRQLPSSASPHDPGLTSRLKTVVGNWPRGIEVRPHR